MSDEQPSYFAYRLRLRQVNEADKSLWRASLEDPITGEHIGFANLEGLFEFLEEQLGGTIDRQDRFSSKEKKR